MKMKNFRNNGAVGAILDEYEKALSELKGTINGLSEAELTQIRDTTTEDPDCVSIQTVLAHVVSSGYNYAIVIRKWSGEQLEYKEKIRLPSVESYQTALDAMFAYNVQLFEDYPSIPLEEFDTTKKIHVRWGQTYDVEQLFEHAIVHILRHRRQIERFLQ